MRDLGRLLSPQSIAVVGGGAWGAHVVRNCLASGYSGDIWPVHPSRAEVEGVATFPSIQDLPGVPDAAYVAVNRHRTVEAVGALAASGCGGAVCFASGFLEATAEDAGAADLQAQLLEAAGDMPVIGPNCYGFLNYLDGAALWPDQHGARRVDRGVAIICQSSNIALNITMNRRGLPIAYLGTAGNQAQVTMADIGAAMLADPRVTALGLHIEGIGDIRAFEGLARASRDLAKPIVALKVGRSQAARQATVSHTASLAGSDAGGRAFLSRLGVAEVTSLPALLETLKLLHVAGPLASNRVASMSCSGGEASLVADTAVGRGLEFPPLDKTQFDGLRKALGPMVALANPLDYHTYIWRNPAKMAEAFSAMMTGDLGLGVIVLDFPRHDRCRPGEWYDVVTGARAARAAHGRPMALVATLAENMPEVEAVKLIGAGIVPLCGLDEALTAMEAAAWLGRHRTVADPVALPGPGGDANLIPEDAAKAELSACGLDVPSGRVVADAEQTAQAAAKIGFPVALKALGHAHKTEVGAVALGLGSADMVRSAARAMTGDSFLVEEMVPDGVAEILVGVTRDPAHGLVLTIGAGGTMTELLNDSVSLMVPASRGSVDAAIATLRINALLQGYRGRPPANREALLDAIDAVQAYVLANRAQIEEVEVNPLIVTPSRAVAVDALIRKVR